VISVVLAVFCMRLPRVATTLDEKKILGFFSNIKDVLKRCFSNVVLRRKHIKSNRINLVMLSVIT